ncbi:MAG: hypothetical protein ABH896_00520, partial [Candidatus Jacksonbacteria bacterium]
FAGFLLMWYDFSAMNTLTLNKLNTEVITIKQDINFLRSLLISLAGKDQEGEYNPKFVREMQKAVKETANYSFKNAKSFLSQLETA